jgi:hypothetical protein
MTPEWTDLPRSVAKISRVTGTPGRPIEHPFEYANTFAREEIAGGVERLRIGLRGGHARALPMLGGTLAPPYKLLWVLHTTRVDNPLGRYESPALDGPGVSEFFDRFGPFFAEDARSDIWLHSPDEDGTIVLDRYNMIHAYGPLERFERYLAAGGVQPVAEWAAPTVPSPNAIHYHAAWDAAEREIIGALDWKWCPLEPEDVRYWPGPQPL